MINWIKKKIDFHSKRFNPHTASVDDAIIRLLTEMEVLFYEDNLTEEDIHHLSKDINGTYSEGFMDGYRLHQNLTEHERANSATGSRLS
jgi:hypothetical protein